MKKRTREKDESLQPDNTGDYLQSPYSGQPIEYIKSSLKRLSTTRCPIERFTILNNVTEAKTFIGNYVGAIKTTFRTSSIATSIDNEVFYGKSLLSRASSFLWLGKIERALEIVQKCFQIGERNNSRTLQCKCLLLLARIDLLKDYPERSESNIERATCLASAIGNTDLITAGKLLQCELLLSSGRHNAAIQSAELYLSELDENRGPLQNEIRTLLGGLYSSGNRIIKALNYLSMDRQFSRHSMGWGLNQRLRLATVHLKANQIEEAESILRPVKYKTLPPHEQYLFWKIKIKIARTKCKHKALRKFKHEIRAFEEKTEQGIVRYGNMQADLLDVQEAPAYSEIIDNSGQRLVSKKETELLKPEEWDLFYNTITGNIYCKGLFLEFLSPKGIKGALLTQLMKNSGRYYNHKDIYEKIWKCRFNPEFNDNNVYVTMSKLRKIVKDRKNHTNWQFLKSSDPSAYAFEPAADFRWAIVIPAPE